MNNFPNLMPLYEVWQLVAEGGTAKIYRAHDKRSGFVVAIKELKIRHFKNQTIREKFKDIETQLLLHSQHPNFPKLIDFIDMKEQEQLYIVMEFIEGKTLEHYIYREVGLIPEQKALPLFSEILDTVAYLHNMGIPNLNNGTRDKGFLHLDIKPNNIMLQPNGKIKLIDLGIASRMSDAGNTGYGTLAYMPPEQTEKGKCGCYTDVFALGIMLFEMLTGTVPFNSQNPDGRQANEEIRQKIKRTPTPQMKQFYPHINADLQQIVERATAKNPDDRYQSCEEFQNVIKSYMYKHKIK